MNHKKVQRIMRKLVLKEESSFENHVSTVLTKVLSVKSRRTELIVAFTPIPYQKLTTDITEFKCADGGKLYLSPIMDMFNGEIISYGISMHPTLILL